MGICTTVKLRDGRTFSVTSDGNEVTLGRHRMNDVPLMHRLVSKRHARIVLRDGKLIIVDLKSTNGTFVNGKRISSPQVLKDDDKIYLADFTITVGTPPVTGGLAPGHAPPWAGDAPEDEPTDIVRAAPAPEPGRNDDDEATPPVGQPPSPGARVVSQNDEPALLMRNELTGQVHMVTKFGMSIGRKMPPRAGTTAPGVQIDSASVSLQHARITHDGARFVLGDLNSVHGTFLVDAAGRERRLVGASTAPLATNMRIRVGDTTFIVLESSTAQRALIALRALEQKLEEERHKATAPPRSPAMSKGKVVIDDGDALGVAPGVPAPRPTLTVRVGGVSVGELVREEGLVRISHGRASGREARITELCENLRDDAEFAAMFRDMVKLVTLFQTSRLPRLLASDPHLLATSPPPGTPLTRVLERHGRIAAHVAVHIAIECARVLAEFHEVNNDTGRALHPVLRKLTPITVEIARDGTVHIGEFMLAKTAATWRESETAAGVIKGDFFSMSPEQVRGQPLDARSDLWSLGVLLYTMIDGANPFRGSPTTAGLEALERIAAGKVPPLRDAPEPLHDALARLLSGDPDGRPATARDAVKLLEGVALTLPPASRLDVERLLRAMT